MLPSLVTFGTTGRRRRQRIRERAKDDLLHSGPELPTPPDMEKEQKPPRALREIQWAQSLSAQGRKPRRTREREGSRHVHAANQDAQGSKATPSGERATAGESSVTAFRMGWDDPGPEEGESGSKREGKKRKRPDASRKREKRAKRTREQVKRDVAAPPLQPERVGFNEVADGPPAVPAKANSNRLAKILQRQISGAGQDLRSQAIESYRAQKRARSTGNAPVM